MKHVLKIESPDRDTVGATVPAKTLASLREMINDAQNAPPTARYRMRLSMGGKLKELIVEWED